MYVGQRASLVAFAAMLLGSRSTAEDVVQESFTRLMGSPHLAIDNPSAYLRSVVVNACKRELRFASRSRPLEVADLAPSLDRAHHDLLDAVSRLSPRRRTAVLLRYYLDLPVTEVADLMECKPSTVSSLLHRAHRELKEKLP
jgi:RNA polymerase sigma factor (sigma-70 family)